MTSARKQTISVLRRGVFLGARAGAALSIAYTATAIPMLGILLVVTNIPSGKVFDALIGAWMLPICAWPFAVLMGILPGSVLGAIGGLLIGLIVLPIRTRVTQGGAAIIGLIVAIGMVGSVHALMYPGIIGGIPSKGVFKYLPYLFWVAFPSVLVLTGLTWVGWKLLAADSESEDAHQ